MFHTLEIAAQGQSLQVALDGQLVPFVQDGRGVTTVAIPPTGGSNDGTLGIAFGAEDNRGQVGDQRADDLLVTRYRSLADLPTHPAYASGAR